MNNWLNSKIASTPVSCAVMKRTWLWSKEASPEEELKQCVERYRTSRKSAEKKTEVVAEEAW